jgi:hypothetical protein
MRDDFVEWAHKAKSCPELGQAQAVGRPEWQRGLPLSVLTIIDRKANAAASSVSHLQDYIDYTKKFRTG